METYENHDWLTKEWTELLEDFKQAYKHIRKIAEEPLAHPIRVYFEKAGKAFL